MSKIVIVGAVGGGATVAGQIRFYDPDADITIFDRDSTMSYAACGTPYVIGNIIKEPESLLMADPQQFKEKRNIDVFLKHEVLEIQRQFKQVLVRNLDSGEQFAEPYDTLILAPGGSAVIPEVDGLPSANVFVLRSYDDMEGIQHFIKENKPKTCVISGAGFIGLEMAENLKHLGLKVQIVHKSSQVMSILDTDISERIEAELAANNIHLHKDTVITKAGPQAVELSDGSQLEADFIIMSVGIKPNTELAEGAGLPIGKTGGIVTNEYMQTEDPSIFALGDASENTDMITGDAKRVPLAWPAHRQAFLIAQKLSGNAIPKKGLLGTSVVKIFSLTVAMTGLNERTIRSKGLAYKTVVHQGNSNAGYYPDHAKIMLKIHYDADSRKILGAQCIGGKGVDKRIDVLVTAIYAGLTIDDLQALELSYAPPYSSPKDPINMAGYKAFGK
ncbi:CoA-disulfide reductase [Planococcus liqunii]|uniref:CoA-disulfide reductase n=1 Tax=Planococcus liqunii TaxID=3058394 RepID=UPI002635AF02|nr:CoA-disulfide reductase [Planococcus sp. N056]WKA49974.1 CoA-disulfide reductase [Planococcus sp. N056]